MEHSTACGCNQHLVPFQVLHTVPLYYQKQLQETCLCSTTLTVEFLLVIVLFSITSSWYIEPMHYWTQILLHKPFLKSESSFLNILLKSLMISGSRSPPAVRNLSVIPVNSAVLSHFMLWGNMLLSSAHLTCCVPQGSILGLILFSIYCIFFF